MIKSDKLLIAHRDDDPLHNHKDNLIARNWSSHFKHVHDLGRMPHSATLNRYITTEARHWAANEKFRPVSQYDMNGNLIAAYDCLCDAAAASGAYTGNIRAALTGKKISAAGFLWREGNGVDTIDVTEVKKRIHIHKRKQSKLISRYDLSGNRLDIFTSIAAAAHAMNGHRAAIRKVMNKENRTSYNSIWREGKGPIKIKRL